MVTTTGIRTVGRDDLLLRVGLAAWPRTATTPRPASASPSGRMPDDLDIEAAAADAARRATRLLGATQPAQRPGHRGARPLRHRPVPRASSAPPCRARRCSRAGRCSPTGWARRWPPPRFTLVDDATNPLAYSASETDGEGLASRRNVLIDGGRLQPVRAQRLHRPPVRHGRPPPTPCGASRPRRRSAAGPCRWPRAPSSSPSCSPTVGDGVLISSVSGLHSGVNPVSGDFSTGAEGLRITGGELGEPLREFTIASTLQRMLADVAAVGADIEWLPMRSAGVSLVVRDRHPASPVPPALPRPSSGCPRPCRTFEAIVLGIVQGLTEFLPISSSGHLRIVPALFGWDDPGAAFTAVIQLGHDGRGGHLLLEGPVADHHRLAAPRCATRTRRSRPRRPHGLVPHRRHHPDRDPRLGLQGPDRVRRPRPAAHRQHADRDRPGAAVAEQVARAPRTVDDVDTRDGVAIGLAQSHGPGARRVPLGRHHQRRPVPRLHPGGAARFSFLLSIPAVVLSGLFSLKDVGAGDGPGLAPDVDRHGRLVRGRLRRHRLAAQVPRRATAPGLRGLPGGPRPAADRAARHQHHRRPLTAGGSTGLSRRPRRVMVARAAASATSGTSSGVDRHHHRLAVGRGHHGAGGHPAGGRASPPASDGSTVAHTSTRSPRSSGSGGAGRPGSPPAAGRSCAPAAGPAPVGQRRCRGRSGRRRGARRATRSTAPSGTSADRPALERCSARPSAAARRRSSRMATSTGRVSPHRWRAASAAATATRPMAAAVVAGQRDHEQPAAQRGRVGEGPAVQRQPRLRGDEERTRPTGAHLRGAGAVTGEGARPTYGAAAPP